MAPRVHDRKRSEPCHKGDYSDTRHRRFLSFELTYNVLELVLVEREPQQHEEPQQTHCGLRDCHLARLLFLRLLPWARRANDLDGFALPRVYVAVCHAATCP